MPGQDYTLAGVPVEFYIARMEPRDDYHHQIEYVLGPSSSGEIHKAVTINVSESGIGLYVFKPLAEGQQIMIKNAIRGSRKTGTIRWNKKVNESIYRVGVMFAP